MKRVAVQRRRYWPVTILFVLIGAMLLTGQWQVSHAEAAKSALVRGVSTPALATSATRIDPRVPTPKAPVKKPTQSMVVTPSSSLLCNNAPLCGVVTLAGTNNVVPNVRVHLVDSNGNDVAGFSQNPYTVGGNGAFVFGDSGTGSHNPGTFPLNTPLSLMFDPGPTNPNLLKVWWEDKWSTSTACQFKFSDQSTATMVRCGASGTLIPNPMNQQMYQGAVIAGTVTDINTNATLSGIQVDAFGALCSATGLSTFTNENGDYVISGLADSSSAGNYLMRFTDPNGTYAVQWYNNLNVVSCPGAQGGATAITAVTATPATGKDAHLGQSHSLSVGVVNASHQSVSGVSLLLWLVDGSGNPVSSVSPSFDDGNGGFIFSNVDPNASYKLYANPGTTVGYMPEWYTPSVGGTDNVSAATVIPGSTDSLVVTLDVGGIINGAVSKDNPNGTNPPTIALDGVVVKVFDTNISTTQPVATSTSGTGGTSGSFTTPANLRPDGLYIVEYVPPSGQPFAITWYKHADSLPNYGTSSSSTADIQTVTKGQITTLGNITMPAVKASITGQVFDPTNSPLSSTVTTIHIWKQNNNGDGQNCAAPNVNTANGNQSYYVRYGDSSTDPIVNVGQTNYTTPSLPLGCYALQFDPQTIDPKVSGYIGGWFTGTSGTPPTDISGAAAISLTLGGASAKNINLPFAIIIAGTIFNSQNQGAAGVAVV